MPSHALTYLSSYSRLAAKIDTALLWRLNWDVTTAFVKDEDNTMATNIALAYGGLGSAIEDVVSNRDPSKYVRLRYNPQVMRKSFPLLNSHKKMAGDNFEIINGGRDMVNIEFQGTSGFMKPVMADYRLYDTQLSYAAINHEWFIEMYNNSGRDKGIVRMIFEGYKFDGYMSNLNTTWDAKSTYERTYSFTFHAIPNSIVGLSSIILPYQYRGTLRVASSAMNKYVAIATENSRREGGILQ